MQSIAKVCKTTQHMAEMRSNEHRLLVIEKKLHLLSDLMLTMHHNPNVHTPSTRNLAWLPHHNDAFGEADILAALRANSHKLDRANGRQHTGHSATSPSATEETDDDTNAHDEMQHSQLHRKSWVQSRIQTDNTKAAKFDAMETADKIYDNTGMPSRKSATAAMPVNTANADKTPSRKQDAQDIPLCKTPIHNSNTQVNATATDMQAPAALHACSSIPETTSQTTMRRQVVQQGSAMLGGRAERRVTSNPYIRHVPFKFRSKTSNKRWLVEFQINLGRLHAKTQSSETQSSETQHARPKTGGLLKLQHKFNTNAEAQAWRNECLERHGVQLVINADGYWEQVPLQPL